MYRDLIEEGGSKTLAMQQQMTNSQTPQRLLLQTRITFMKRAPAVPHGPDYLTKAADSQKKHIRSQGPHNEVMIAESQS